MYCTVVLLFLAKFRFFLAEYLYNMHIQSPFTTFINFEIKKAAKNLGPSHNNIYYARNVSEYIYKYRYIKRNFSQKLKVQFYVKCGYFLQILSFFFREIFYCCTFQISWKFHHKNRLQIFWPPCINIIILWTKHCEITGNFHQFSSFFDYPKSLRAWIQIRVEIFGWIRVQICIKKLLICNIAITVFRIQRIRNISGPSDPDPSSFSTTTTTATNK